MLSASAHCMPGKSGFLERPRTHFQCQLYVTARTRVFFGLLSLVIRRLVPFIDGTHTIVSFS